MFKVLWNSERRYKPTAEELKHRIDCVKHVENCILHPTITKRFKRFEKKQARKYRNRMKMFARQSDLDKKPPIDSYEIATAALIVQFTPRTCLLQQVEHTLEMKKQLLIQAEFFKEFQQRVNSELKYLKEYITKN